MAKINSAAELNVAPEQQANTLQGIRTTALEQVRQFCERNNLQPAQFMSAMGWLNERDWRRGVDWKDCVNWNSFNSMVFSNITPNRKGLDVSGFRHDLEASRETYVQNATPQPQQRRAEQRPAQEQQRAAPQREEAPAQRQPRVQSQMSAQTWANAYSQTESALDGYPKLSEEDRTAIHNIVDRTEPGNRSLIEMNLRSYLRLLSADRHLISQEDAGRIFSDVMAASAGAEQAMMAERRGPTVRPVQPEQRLARAGLNVRGQEEQAPGRQEQFVYRVTVTDARGEKRDNPQTVSTFEITTTQQIENPASLTTFLGNPPPGTNVVRIANSGARIPLNATEMDRFRSGVYTILNTPGMRIELAQQGQGGAGGRA